MPLLSLAFLGDIVGPPGLKAFAHAAKSLRDSRRADLIVVNAENHKNGSGLSPDGYREVRRAGADAITLGDHVYKDRKIADILEDPTKPAARPANLSIHSRGKTRTRVHPVWHESPTGTVSPSHAPAAALAGVPPIYVVTVLGRIFMSLPANDPFEAIDRECAAIAAEHDDALVIVEVHAEATSEKIAMAWHCHEHHPGRVVAVVGTHTHVQTADARIIDHRLAAMTDLGMCGGHRGVIGRKVPQVLAMMTRQDPHMYEVADEEPLACGCVIGIDTDERRATRIEPVRLDPTTSR